MTPVNIFSTSPSSASRASRDYLADAIDVARFSEDLGCRGILIYTDNSEIDPWLVAQMILENTRRISPLIAVQPVYMHPYSVAKMVSSLAFLHNRKVCLNMVAGGFRNDLTSLNDATDHARRYDRLIEYTTIIRQLLSDPGPQNFRGDFFTIHNLRLTPALPVELVPDIFMSGSSAEGSAAALKLGATPVRYPTPPGKSESDVELSLNTSGVRLGIVARDSDDEAWNIARARFPLDRGRRLIRQLAATVSDSIWHQQLTSTPRETNIPQSPYWLEPFDNYHTMCPYLVGSHDRVGDLLRQYHSQGHGTFILDIPPTADDLAHTMTAFARAGLAPSCIRKSS